MLNDKSGTWFPEFLFDVFIRMARVQYSSILCTLCTCVSDGTFPASSSASAGLVGYSMIKASAYFFAAFLPEYADRSPVIIYVSLTFDVTFGNLRCS